MTPTKISVRFGIWTTVSGTRSAWLKAGGGTPYVFPTKERAAAFRARLHTNLNGGYTPSGRAIPMQTFEVRELP